MILKDYLHFYLGCDIQHEDGTIEKLKSIDTEISYVNFGWGNAKQMDKVKLILRPLSDMTEDERSEAVAMSKVFKYDAEQMKYLLSKQFDLFGLIEAGYAIKITRAA